jgi:DNA-directed RNA polymerase specialized sigma subunit
MANIPKAREILTEALEFNMDSEVRTRIEAAIQEMYRDYSLGRKAPNQSSAVTDDVKRLVRMYAKTFPDITQQQIAQKFNINAGRVSEILTGKR